VRHPPPHTYATLNILLPDEVDDLEALSSELGLAPTSVTRRGTPLSKASGKGRPRHRKATHSSWSFSTADLPLSNDAQEHVDWILARLTGKEDVIRRLVASKHWIGVVCHWLSEHERPSVSDETVRHLDDLGLTLDFELER
jgi:hypothetical protein